MHRQILMWLALALVMLVLCPPVHAKQSAAVLPLEKGAGDAQFDGLGRSLADMIVSDLSQADTLVLVERVRLSSILDELKLSQSNYIDARWAQRIGRGVSADYIITGSYSVVGTTFSMSCRVFSSEQTTIVVSVQSHGEIDDFVAIEKDIVEKLLAALKVKLSPRVRRAVLLRAPTENAKALASYGRGSSARDAGKLRVAQKEFAKALEQDPDFAKASKALRELSGRVEKELDSAEKRSQSKRAQAIAKALAAIPSEMTRSANFTDTMDSVMNFSIRQYLLYSTKQHCKRYEELKHYLFRRKGGFTSWYAHLPGTADGLTNFATAAAIARSAGTSARAFGDRCECSLF